MKVLWFTHSPMPDMAVAFGLAPSSRGGWMTSLAQALCRQEGCDLAVVTALKVSEFRRESVNGVTYYALPDTGGSAKRGFLTESLIQGYQKAVDDFSPDIIHIHGTEYYEGLLTARGHIKHPTVISIQGIIDACRKYYWGGIPFRKLLTSRTLRDWVRLDGLIEQRFQWEKRAELEREIFSNNPAFIGRTLWDKAHTRRLSPKARYHHCDEMLRAPFFEKQWRLSDIKRHSIFTSSASYPLKGFHVLVKAVSLLKEEFPDITIRTPLAQFYPSAQGFQRLWKNIRSTGYARYLTDLIRAEGMEKHIVSFPSLDANGMLQELLDTHIFVLPSFIENSSNALAESMLVGAPTVSSYVGGLPSMAGDGSSVLFFPAGDESVLAEQIRRLFQDDRLACELSDEARRIAAARHSVEAVVGCSLEIYRKEIALQNQ